jgi:hypothetical protein
MLKATAGVIATATDGTDYFSSSYAIPNANIGCGLNNALGIAGVQQFLRPTAGTPFYVTNSQITFPATSKTGGGIVSGSRISWEICVWKDANGTGTLSVIIYRGTNGTTADFADVTRVVTGAQTAAADTLLIKVIVVINNTGGAGSYYWSICVGRLCQLGTATNGFNPLQQLFNGLVTGVALNTASLRFGIGLTQATGATLPLINIPYATVQAFNLT